MSGAAEAVPNKTYGFAQAGLKPSALLAQNRLCLLNKSYPFVQARFVSRRFARVRTSADKGAYSRFLLELC